MSTGISALNLPRFRAPRWFVPLGLLLLVACGEEPREGPLAIVGPAREESSRAGEENAALVWNRVMLQAVRTSSLPPPITARALGIVHTAMYDAWAAYHPVADPTRPEGPGRRPAAEQTEAARARAVSFAAYHALERLYPAPDHQQLFARTLASLGYRQEDAASPADAAAVGRAAALAVLAYREEDGANQLGGYADYTDYLPKNRWDEVTHPSRWQPLHVPTAEGGFVIQSFVAPHWMKVTPFALSSASQFRPPPPAPYKSAEYLRQVQAVLELSARLGDREKAIAEYWADGPASEQPPGHWNLIAQQVSRRDRHTLDRDVQMFFLLNNALFDAGVAAWDAKCFYDYVRPITAIRYLLRGREVRAWGGPGKGTITLRGEAWNPYQPSTFLTPAFAEYVSGHSTFSAAGAEVLKRFTGSDRYGATFTMAAGSARTEPGLAPARPVRLAWKTFSEAAAEAGMSRLYGGIHFPQGDIEGRELGRKVAGVVWERGQRYIQGQERP